MFGFYFGNVKSKGLSQIMFTQAGLELQVTETLLGYLFDQIQNKPFKNKHKR